MRFDVSVAHEACCTRIRVTGDPTPGHLLSLLNVLEVDSTSWPREPVLLDLRGLGHPLTPQEQSALATEAARALRRMKKIAVVACAAAPADTEAVRFFDDAETALRWIA